MTESRIEQRALLRAERVPNQPTRSNVKPNLTADAKRTLIAG
jgi:hypothetical protein